MRVPSYIPYLLIVFVLSVIHFADAILVSNDDCEDGDANSYRRQGTRSASYSSGYTQQHPTVNGYQASSSQYVRTGGASSSALNSGYRTGGSEIHPDDLQVATSYYSPTVANYGSGSGYRETSSSSYGSRHSTSASGYGGSGYNYGNSHQSSGSLNSESHVREKFEDLKQKADSYVHGGTTPPIGASLASSADRYGGGSASGYQSSQRYQSERYGGVTSGGNVLDVTYGAPGVDEDDSQKLIPVHASLSPSSSSLINHRENQNSVISYSSSGSGTHGNSLDYSISQNTQTVPTLSSGQYATYDSGSVGTSQVTKEFEVLKQKANEFVHEGAPPPSSQLSSSSLQQSSTHVETLPAKSTDRGTIVVPVRVTVTREQTVLPGEYVGAEDQQGAASVLSSSKKESYSSHSSSSSSNPQVVSYQSGTIGTVGNTAGSTSYSQTPVGSSSSYSYNSDLSRTNGALAPQVYRVTPQSGVYYPETQGVSEKSTGYGSSSTYSKSSSTLHRDNVVVPGAGEDYTQKSNKLFDLVSGYGTFLPAKETVVTSSVPDSSSQVSSTYSSSSNVHSGQSGSQSSLISGQQGGSGFATNYQNGYQGVSVPGNSVPIGGGRKTTTVYTYSSNNLNPSYGGVRPGVPQGDPNNPPELSGSYFNGVKQYSTQAESTGYRTTGQQNIAGGYGAGRGYSSSNDERIVGGYTGSRDQNIAREYSSATQSRDSTLAALGVNRDQNLALNGFGAECKFCDDSSLIAGGSTGGVKKYGISSSWSSKSQTVNGKTVESKQAQVTVDDNGKIDTYATHNRK